MLSETIVLLWLLPVVLNIILPLAVLGVWLGIKFLRIVRNQAISRAVDTEAESVRNRILSATKG